MAFWRSMIEPKTLRLSRRLVRVAKKPSTAFSQEAGSGQPPPADSGTYQQKG
jgi:hypothetical protein